MGVQTNKNKCQQTASVSPHSYPLSRKGSCEGHSNHTQHPGCSCGWSTQADPVLSAPLASALYESCFATPELRAWRYNKRGPAVQLGRTPASIPPEHVHVFVVSPLYPGAQNTSHVMPVTVAAQVWVYWTPLGAPVHVSADRTACAFHKRSTTLTGACWGWLANCRNKQARSKM